MDAYLQPLVASGVVGLFTWLGTRQWHRRKLHACHLHVKSLREEVHQLDFKLKEAKQQIGSLKMAADVRPPTARPAAAAPLVNAVREVKRELRSSHVILPMLDADDGHAKRAAHGFADTMPFID
ncbi:MAG: hypothetical protein ABIV63_12595 [Caldimonas sp.]